MAKGKNKPEGADVKLMEQLFDDNNDDNIVMFDEDGEPVELEQVAAVEFEGECYAVLHVIGDPEGEVIVFRIDPTDEDSLILVEDDELAEKILQIIMSEGQ